MGDGGDAGAAVLASEGGAEEGHEGAGFNALGGGGGVEGFVGLVLGEDVGEGGEGGGGGCQEGGVFGFGLELGEAVGFHGEVIAEEIVDPLGELGEEVDFFADAVDGSGGVGFVFDDEASAVEEGAGGGKHGFRGEIAQVVGVEPLQLGGVEAGVAGVDLAGVEELDEGLAIELFGFGAGCPAEEAKVVEDGFGEVAFVGVAGDGGAFVALAHFGAAGVQNEGDVSVGGRVFAEGFEEVDVLPGVGEVVLAPEHVGDAHFDVVHDVDEVEDVAAVGAAEGHVGLFGGGEFDIAANEVGDGDGGAGELEADGAGFLGVGAAGGGEGVEVAVVDGLALALEVGAAVAAGFGAFIPVDAEPAETFEDGVAGGFGVTRFVGVLDAEDEGTMKFAGVEPVEQGGAGAADVEVAGGGRGEADADGHGGRLATRAEMGDGR